jgi:hypothetical protein
MDKHEEDFEQFLRQFRPRQPRTLPESPPGMGLSMSAWLMAATMVVICVGGFLLLSRVTPMNVSDGSLEAARPANVAEAMTVGRLTRLAVLDPRQLDATLIEASPSLLPDVERSGSTLRVLAKD